ncbi:MFS transporter [Celeribacter arenosi]|uniref:MFS transporter n=1 Tax=Celeribacter arenosi TaxID=792649 RepID=A0ABP7K1E5_9RHOB
MVKGFFWLVLAYGLSQFYRACLAVFAPVLAADISVGAEEISRALGAWFLAFAAMQIPVGWLLDNRSPRITAAALLFTGGGGGALVFASAQSGAGILAAMILIGIGCSSVLMTSFYIFARLAAPARFGALAGLVLGVGSIGNVIAAAPLSWSLEAIGWRATMVAIACLTGLVALALWRFVEDPPRITRASDEKSPGLGTVLRLWPLYPILAIALVSYAPGAGLRGSWIGGYLSDVYGLDAGQIGTATVYMALAMIAGSLLLGPLDRLIPSSKGIVLGCGILGIVTLFLLWKTAGTASLTLSVVLFMAIGFFASSYPQVMNHGRSLLPPELTGRGVTLINLFSIGGVGLSQIATAEVFSAASSGGIAPLAGYGAVFAFFAIALAVGCVIYLFSTQRS